MLDAIQHMPITSVNSVYGTQNQVQLLRQPQAQTASMNDVNHVKNPQLMTDEDIDSAMSVVRNSVQQSAAEALSVHGGLDYSRVMALLADV